MPMAFVLFAHLGASTAQEVVINVPVAPNAIGARLVMDYFRQ
ncbi:MAG: hypothetical protein ACI8PQ_001646 [Planctomycetota bacterium]|jgi:hypothetical protein